MNSLTTSSSENEIDSNIEIESDKEFYNITMTEADIQIVNKEEHQDEESLEQKIIFDNSIFEQIKGKELDLSVAKIFEIPTIRNWFK